MSKRSTTTAVAIASTPAKSPVGALSARGGAMLMRSITRFLAKNKSAAANNNAATVGRVSRHCRRTCGESSLSPPTQRRHKKMTGKDGKGKLSMRVIEAIKKETHFNKTEIEALYKVYRKLITMNRPKVHRDKGRAIPAAGPSSSGAAGVAAVPAATAQTTAAPVNTPSCTVASSPAGVIRKANAITEGIDRTVFCELMHITFDIVTEDMLMERIFCVWDRENANLITPMSWFAGLSVFLRGTTMEQIEFCFAVYDLNVDGFITKEEMFQLLKNCLIKHPQEEDPDEGVKDFVEIVMRKLDKDKDGKVSLNDYRQSVLEEPLLLEAFGKCLPEDRARDTFLCTMKV